MDIDNDQLNDMGEYFDFGGASTQAVPDFPAASAPPDAQGFCPSHPGTDSCLCHGFMDDIFAEQQLVDLNIFDGQPPSGDALCGPMETQEFNNDFSSWIPRYSKPEQACDYCRDRQLDCFTFTLYEGHTTCSPCNALFRHCSFSKAPTDQQRPKGALDTLHLVPEDVCQEQGAMTGLKSLKSFLTGLDESERNAKKSGTRFSRVAIRVLKDWIEEHCDHPYPTDEEKDVLKDKTGLKGAQISNWLANARRRGKVRPKGTYSPSIQSSSQAIDIPGAAQAKTWDAMNPLERWEQSPPENEPASVVAIAHAVAATQYDRPSGTSSEDELRRNHDSSNGSSFSLFKAPSSTSFGTRQSSGSAGSFDSAAWSHGSRNSFGSLGSIKKKDRRRPRRPAPPARDDSNKAKRVYQCTFCTDTFLHKFDWTRHEKSLHIKLEKWICAPIGPVTVDSASGQKRCVFCGELDPSRDHVEAHNHNACEEKGFEARTFYRKDHLRQHLRLMHDCKMISSMDSWKCEATYIRSRCGFCGEDFTRWQQRVDHLAKHFLNGSTMKDWRGCRGLDMQVAAQVTNAMPPYLIGNEAKSPAPFSATNEASMRPLEYSATDLEALIPPLNNEMTLNALFGCHKDPNWVSHGPESGQLPPQLSLPSRNATCWEILTVRLGQFVKEQHAQGNTVTDEMLQRESRNLLYGDYDPWNQTVADNPEWLALFKKAHGLDSIPAGAGRTQSPQQLDLDPEDLFDLGLGQPVG